MASQDEHTGRKKDPPDINPDGAFHKRIDRHIRRETENYARILWENRWWRQYPDPDEPIPDPDPTDEKWLGLLAQAEKAVMAEILSYYTEWRTRTKARPKGTLPNWITGDPRISDALNKIRLREMLIYLIRVNVRLNYEQSCELVKTRGIRRIERETYHKGVRMGVVYDIPVLLPEDLADRIAAELSMSRETVRKYLRELCRISILRNLGSERYPVYALGYWQVFKGGAQVRHFMKNMPEIRRGLQSFRVPR